jgi:hypothetical protein
MTENEKTTLPLLFNRFNIGATVAAIERIGMGHINDTFRIITDGPGENYILQKINSSVFKNISGLMKNIHTVTLHLEKKIRSGDPKAAGFAVLRLVVPDKDHLYLEDEEGSAWRMYNDIAGTQSFDVAENEEMAYKAGKAYGLFQYLTSDISGCDLHETIPQFHHIGNRLEQYQKALRLDPEKRKKDLGDEIQFVERRKLEMQKILRLLDDNSIPLRVTHNDTKLNNVLFDEDRNPVCIVDLDTVMPGCSLYDFGDAIRTGATRAAEDEPNLEKVTIDLPLFKAYTHGYLESAGSFLNKHEIANLAFSARFMTFIIGLRFLTDHINGDKYFRIRFPGHNLQRARAQFRLLQSMEENSVAMEEMVRGGEIE